VVTVELNKDPPVQENTSASHFLLESKFVIPETPPFWVARPALTARVEAGVAWPVTLIAGPAGCGKTQLVASWVKSRGSARPIAWLTLEDEDDQASTFWSYLIEAIRRAEPSFDQIASPVPAEAVEHSVLNRIAAELSRLPGPVVLVLDGVSQLSGGQWASDLDYVIRHSEQRLRLVLVGRWDPPLPLYRYRLAGALTEIRSSDLAFTRDEAARLLALHDVRLGDEAMNALVDRTEGWAAGLRLFATSLQGHTDPDAAVATISGDDTAIAEYFVGEVLRSQPAEVRRFLLETSVLDTFTPELAEAVTQGPHVRQILATLSRENAFICPAGDGERFRYHRLFAELLLARLNWEQPEQVAGLHLRAAAWLAEQGAVTEAAAHAARAGEWAQAAAIVVADHAVGRLVIDGTRGRLGAIFRSLPDAPHSSGLAIVRAALAVADGRGDLAIDQLSQAQRTLSEDPDGGDDAVRLGGLLVATQPVVGIDAAITLDAIGEAETLLAVAPADRTVRHPELAVLLLAAKAAAQDRCGPVEVAAASLAEAIAAAVEGCEPVTIGCLGRLALIEAYRGRLNRAVALARRALELAERHGLRADRWPVTAQLALAWAEVERYDVEAADRHLRAAQPRCAPGGDGTAVTAFAIVRSRRLQARGELRCALGVLREAESADPRAPAWLRRENSLAQARLLVAAGHLDKAQEVVGRMPDIHGPDMEVVRGRLLLAQGEPERAHEIIRAVADGAGIPPPLAVEAWLLLATHAAGDNDVPGARESLRRALRAAAPEGHRRTLHLALAQLRRVLREDDELLMQYQALGGENMGPARGATAREADPVLVEALSKRELDVLRGMAAMLPTEEIAASMFVSINTVKTHVRSILRKLSASRRNEAVRRARSLHLI
jgi:LuxR family maltose regulon positive regulatory protein